MGIDLDPSTAPLATSSAVKVINRLLAGRHMHVALSPDDVIDWHPGMTFPS